MSARSRARGREGTDSELGMVIGQIRRTLSTCFVRAQSLCLLSRLCHLGKGAKEAAGRRVEAKRKEFWRRKEMESHFMAHMRGRGLSRIGSMFTS